jgi:hypothetical protein
VRGVDWVSADNALRMLGTSFLVGLTAGASAALARVVAQSTASRRSQRKGAVGDAEQESMTNSIDTKRKPTKQTRQQKPMVVTPKRWVSPAEPPKCPCEECRGGGRVACEECRGRGRTNLTDRALLPKTVWPEWCTYCRGSGKVFCSRCSGSGNQRQKIGFDMDD